MEHHSLPELDNRLILTNSDLKVTAEGREYITIYFEQPNAEGSDFNSMQIEFPDLTPRKVVGFGEEEIAVLLAEVQRIGDIALRRAREDAAAGQTAGDAGKGAL